MSRNKEGATRHTFIKKTFLLFFSTEKNKSITCKRIASSVHKEKFFKLKKGVLEPEFFDAWEILHKAGVDDAIKRNADNVKNFQKYLEKSKGFKKEQNSLLKYEKSEGTHFVNNNRFHDGLETGHLDELTFSYKYKTGPNANSKDVYAKIALTEEGHLVGNIKKTTGMDNMNVKGVTEDAMDMALHHFGGIENVKGVKALWVQNKHLYPDLPDNKSINLLKFEEALKTMNAEEAVFNTVTGKYAKSRVFTKVKEIKKLTEAIDGVNGYEVIFVK